MRTRSNDSFPLGARKPSSALFRKAAGGGRAPGKMAFLTLVLSLWSVISAAEGRRNRDADPARSAVPPAATATKAVSPADSFEAFRIIAEKNIFNPNRVGLTRATTEAKPPRVDEIALVGTVEFGGKRVALFESAEVAFRKTVAEGETLGEFTVRRVGNEGVDLVRGDQVLALRVAQRLRRPEGADWSVVAAPDAPRPEASSAPAIPADASDVLKRLMRQREKQLK
jgi:hypothetical protein